MQCLGLWHHLVLLFAARQIFVGYMDCRILHDERSLGAIAGVRKRDFHPVPLYVVPFLRLLRCLEQVHVFPSRDGNLSINVLGYELKDNVNGDASSPAEGILPSRMRIDRSKNPMVAEGATLAQLGEDAGVCRVGDKSVATREAWRPNGELFEYAASVQAGEWKGNPMHPPPGPMVGTRLRCLAPSCAAVLNRVSLGGVCCLAIFLLCWSFSLLTRACALTDRGREVSRVYRQS